MGANQSGGAEEVEEEEPVRKSVRWGEESGTERSVRMMQASGEGGRAKNRSMSVMAAQNFEDRQAQRAEMRRKEREAAVASRQIFDENRAKSAVADPDDVELEEAAPSAGSSWCCCGGDSVVESAHERPAPAEAPSPTQEEPPQSAQPASGGASEEPDPGPSLDEILSKIRQRGRRYEAGTVVLTFHELLTLLAPDEPAEEVAVSPAKKADWGKDGEELATKTVTAENGRQSVADEEDGWEEAPVEPWKESVALTLLLARETGSVAYQTEEEEFGGKEGEEGEAEATAEVDGSLTAGLLRPGKDDSVVITAEEAPADAGGQAPQWRRGSMIPRQGMSAPVTDISEEGDFKYVLIAATAAGSGKPVHLVRGYVDCEYHADVLEEALPPLEGAGYDNIRCVGGGRIKLEKGPPGQMVIYGTSDGFGRADHDKTAAIFRQHYGGSVQIEVRTADDAVSC